MGSTIFLTSLITIALLITVINARNVRASHSQVLDSMNPHLQADTPHYFHQLLDHFDPLEKRTFRQKYYYNDTLWDKHTGPIFLYISGEAPLGGLDTSNILIGQIQAQTKALVVSLEHRYYGESLPFDDISTENLKYLSSKQALSDLADFIVWFKANVASSTTGPVITIGCSYAGALSAWFRLKFPHLTVASYSSSGVVDAVLDFWEFDEQVGIAAGDECADLLRGITYTIEGMMANDSYYTKSLFGAQDFTYDGDFYYMIADIAAETIQYGYRNLMCKQLSGAALDATSLVLAYANFSTSFYYPVFLGADNPLSYTTESLLNTSGANSGRVWWYQTCSELAYFQTAPVVNAIRSQNVNITYFATVCSTAYGDDLFPNTNETNNFYGGKNIGSTRTIFMNSSQDPWQRASITSPVANQSLHKHRNCQLH